MAHSSHCGRAERALPIVGRARPIVPAIVPDWAPTSAGETHTLAAAFSRPRPQAKNVRQRKRGGGVEERKYEDKKQFQGVHFFCGLTSS